MEAGEHLFLYVQVAHAVIFDESINLKTSSHALDFLLFHDEGYASDLFRTLRSWWQLNDSNIEHVRIVIDQNYESDQNNNTASFLIRKVIGIRPQETVHDLIKKCIEAFHLQDPSVDSYVLFATNNQSNPTTHTNPNSSSQSTQITNIPLIG
ncbi:unnamed protein product [Rotaria magnacalcarata]|uniref:Ras-associating domain-containing protein n=1 Tax=Rotaria magnacalcarata TaxID=392030 RepID=A0A8S3IFY4_9BILA|nr:unnamed protein product [Rotaria magnacalcarata]CAF5195818.1 unnamed protein product [Rotaria magnacalcarata]CAF5197200.1 unnamed protein product [Rotaria magnacalcarata]